ncbi:MAG TPA: hypothetical protein VHP83_24345 [Aggregatilineaceae bacterium]|nr:hypothetical protein [Aggregatilineaceae bacterium]
MSQKFIIQDMAEALNSRLFPAVTVWNRLEGRPRTQNFSRALKAEVRDALWMLTRQWQMGEFEGDDAGSPIFAKLHLSTTQLTRYQSEGFPTEDFDNATPLEATVERRPIPFRLNEQNMALDLRLLMGRQWLKLLHTVTTNAADHSEFLNAYPIEVPDPDDPSDAAICAHPETWAMFAAVAGNHMDGGKLYFYLTEKASHHASDGITLSIPSDASDIDILGDRFVKWFEKLYFQPLDADQDAWQPQRLEYQFSVSAPDGDSELVLSADEYYHGRLDWYNFDIDPTRQSLEEPASPDPQGTETCTFIPAPLVFDGMPNTRWWTFEDRRTNFGDIKPDTTDIAKLMLMEFGLVYANDWFLLPLDLFVGSIVQIKGMAVTNVFGERTWIEAAGSGPDDAWQRWSIFTLNTKGNQGEAADTRLLLLPTVPKIQEGKPLEEIMLIRDEVANMVWGVEKRVPLPTGDNRPGAEVAREFLAFIRKPLDEEIARLLARKQTLASEAPENLSPAEQAELDDIIATLAKVLPPEPVADIRYQVMNTVPEEWIPFIPVHVENDIRQIQLQRAAMPRVLAGEEKPQRVRPRTILLREGLDQKPRSPYFLHEEEVPRAGIVVKQLFQRTRWLDGRVWTWLGVQKQIGRGEGASRLAFDQIIDTTNK